MIQVLLKETFPFPHRWDIKLMLVYGARITKLGIKTVGQVKWLHADVYLM